VAVNLSIKAVFVADWFKCDLQVLGKNKPLKVKLAVIRGLIAEDSNVLPTSHVANERRAKISFLSHRA
jgi:hypothetical protein